MNPIRSLVKKALNACIKLAQRVAVEVMICVIEFGSDRIERG